MIYASVLSWWIVSALVYALIRDMPEHLIEASIAWQVRPLIR